MTTSARFPLFERKRAAAALLRLRLSRFEKKIWKKQIGFSPCWELMGLNHLGAGPSQAFPFSQMSPSDATTHRTGDLPVFAGGSLGVGFRPGAPSW